MSAWSWLLRLGQRDADRGDESERGEPGPVLDVRGRPAVGPDGKPLQKVKVVTRRDHLGFVEEETWVDPRDAWQYRDTAWRDRP